MIYSYFDQIQAIEFISCNQTRISPTASIILHIYIVLTVCILDAKYRLMFNSCFIHLAAATAVNLALESSRLKLKPQTSKQRLGKILGLDKSGASSGWK